MIPCTMRTAYIHQYNLNEYLHVHVRLYAIVEVLHAIKALHYDSNELFKFIQFSNTICGANLV